MIASALHSPPPPERRPHERVSMRAVIEIDEDDQLRVVQVIDPAAVMPGEVHARIAAAARASEHADRASRRKRQRTEVRNLLAAGYHVDQVASIVGVSRGQARIWGAER